MGLEDHLIAVPFEDLAWPVSRFIVQIRELCPLSKAGETIGQAREGVYWVR